MGIQWRPVNGYEGKYEVSNTGMVRSLNYNKTGSIQILKPLNNNLGYLKVRLSGKSYFIHRLVAQAFIPNPLNLPQVNHKDENKQNNRVENLEWCTAEYNTNYGNGNKGRELKHNKPIIQIKDGHPILKWASAKLVHQCLGWNANNIKECCKGRRKTANGFEWRYC